MDDKTREYDASHAMFGLSDNASPETPQAPAYAPPGSPQVMYVQAPPSLWSSGGGLAIIILLVALVLLSGFNLYLTVSSRRQLNDGLSKQADQLNLLTRRMDSSDDRYAQLSAQFQLTTEKLGLTEQELSRARSLAANIQKQQQQAVSQLNDAIARKAGAEELKGLQADADAKFGTLSGDIGATRKDLEATKDALLSAKGELTGAIARTHDELIALARKGDRDYFEFNLAKKGSRQKIGTIVIELQKTDAKKNLFTVALLFDDKRTVRKDKAVNEPVYFYAQGAASALELVVNKVAKDTIAGYVSAPKGFLANVPNVLAARPTT